MLFNSAVILVYLNINRHFSLLQAVLPQKVFLFVGELGLWRVTWANRFKHTPKWNFYYFEHSTHYTGMIFLAPWCYITEKVCCRRKQLWIFFSAQPQKLRAKHCILSTRGNLENKLTVVDLVTLFSLPRSMAVLPTFPIFSSYYHYSYIISILYFPLYSLLTFFFIFERKKTYYKL